MNAVTTVPMMIASRYRNGLPISGTTKMPPCGARDVHPNAMLSAPVTAEPAISDGITRNGSPAANGIAPSVMNDAPSTHAALPFSCSMWVNSRLRSTVASAMPERRGHAGRHHRGHDLQARVRPGR